MDTLWLKFSAFMSAPNFADYQSKDYEIVTYFHRLNYSRKSQAIELFGQQLETLVRIPELMPAAFQNPYFITKICEVLMKMTRQEAMAYLLWTGTGATEDGIVSTFVEALTKILQQSRSRDPYLYSSLITSFSDFVMAMCDRIEFLHLIQSSRKCASELKTILDTLEEKIHPFRNTENLHYKEHKQALLKWDSPEMSTFRLIIQQILNGELEDPVE